MSIGKRIKEERLKRKLSQEDVAKAISSTKQAVYKYESGIVTNIPTDKLEKIAQLFEVTPAYLMGWEDTPSPDVTIIPGIFPLKTKKLPIMGDIACGKPIFAEESYDGYIDIEEGINADFCLRAKGDSMIGARIMDGDIVIVKKQDMVQNGEIAVVLIDDEATLKRAYFYPDKNKLILNPENPKYEPLVFIGEELNSIHILGKAVAFQSVIR